MLELYTTATCPYCAEMRQQLEWDGVAFTEYDVDADATARRRLGTLVGHDVLVPVIVEDGRVKQVGVAGRGCYIRTS